jgi:hypothetical protein
MPINPIYGLETESTLGAGWSVTVELTDRTVGFTPNQLRDAVEDLADDLGVEPVADAALAALAAVAAVGEQVAPAVAEIAAISWSDATVGGDRIEFAVPATPADVATAILERFGADAAPKLATDWFAAALATVAAAAADMFDDPDAPTAAVRAALRSPDRAVGVLPPAIAHAVAAALLDSAASRPCRWAVLGTSALLAAGPPPNRALAVATLAELVDDPTMSRSAAMLTGFDTYQSPPGTDQVRRERPHRRP